MQVQNKERCTKCKNRGYTGGWVVLSSDARGFKKIDCTCLKGRARSAKKVDG